MRRKPQIRALLIVVLALSLLGVLPSAAVAAPLGGPGTNYAVDDPFTAARTAWWRAARFGMFIHFGAYSQLQGLYTRPDNTVCKAAEWIKVICNVPWDFYKAKASEFNPAGFDAEAIAQTAADAGQKYIVITTKHHDGYAMWPTNVNTWNLRDHSSFDPNRDILAELKAATERHGIKLGLYYSVKDWHDTDSQNLATWPRYKQRMFAQLAELVENYDPAILWFDGVRNGANPNEPPLPWTAREGEELEGYARGLKPDIILNDRLGFPKGLTNGDMQTPEQKVSDTEIAGSPWETCMTISKTWGYAQWDTEWKDPVTLTRHLTTIAGRGGNFLLNIGPDASGRIPTPQADRLRQMGAWLRTSGQGAAVYGAGSPGLVAEPAWGAVSRSGNKLYASVYQWPAAGGSLKLNARAPFGVTSARVLGSDQDVTVARTGNVLTITPAGQPTNAVATVIELTVTTRPAIGRTTGTGLSAKFWPTPDFSGTPTVTRVDPTVNYNWKFTGSPAPSVPATSFSARWTGSVVAPFTATYTFTTVSGGTVRLWINNKLVVDGSLPHEIAAQRGTIALQAGQQYAIKLEHSKPNDSAAAMKLIWSTPFMTQRVVPTARLYPNAV